MLRTNPVLVNVLDPLTPVKAWTWAWEENSLGAPEKGSGSTGSLGSKLAAVFTKSCIFWKVAFGKGSSCPGGNDVLLSVKVIKNVKLFKLIGFWKTKFGSPVKPWLLFINFKVCRPEPAPPVPATTSNLSLILLPAPSSTKKETVVSVISVLLMSWAKKSLTTMKPSTSFSFKSHDQPAIEAKPGEGWFSINVFKSLISPEVDVSQYISKSETWGSTSYTTNAFIFACKPRNDLFVLTLPIKGSESWS